MKWSDHSGRWQIFSQISSQKKMIHCQVKAFDGNLSDSYVKDDKYPISYYSERWQKCHSDSITMVNDENIVQKDCFNKNLKDVNCRLEKPSCTCS